MDGDPAHGCMVVDAVRDIGAGVEVTITYVDTG